MPWAGLSGFGFRFLGVGGTPWRNAGGRAATGRSGWDRVGRPGTGRSHWRVPWRWPAGPAGPSRRPPQLGPTAAYRAGPFLAVSPPPTRCLRRAGRPLRLGEGCRLLCHPCCPWLAGQPTKPRPLRRETPHTPCIPHGPIRRFVDPFVGHPPWTHSSGQDAPHRLETPPRTLHPSGLGAGCWGEGGRQARGRGKRVIKQEFS